jgi:hypothetical protein
MSLSFRKWLMETDDPVAAWKALRASAGWGDVKNAPVGDKPAIPANAGPVATSRPKPQVNLPTQVVDALQSGFNMGGPVPEQIVRLLGLKDKRYSLVASDILQATPNGAYPFYHEKKAGKPTGRIAYVRGFPISKLLGMI